MDTYGKQTVSMRHIVQSPSDGLGKTLLIQDALVRRGDYHAGVGIECTQVACSPRHGRRRVAISRFTKHVGSGDSGQLLHHQVAIVGIGHHKYMIFWNKADEPFVGRL